MRVSWEGITPWIPSKSAVGGHRSHLIKSIWRFSASSLHMTHFLQRLIFTGDIFPVTNYNSAGLFFLNPSCHSQRKALGGEAKTKDYQSTHEKAQWKFLRWGTRRPWSAFPHEHECQERRFQVGESASSSHNLEKSRWSRLVRTRMPTELFHSNSENCQHGFFFFQHNHLSFQEGALGTTPQRLMESLELVSLGEDRESNRNMSYAVLIATLITSVKMNGGIAVTLSICRSYGSIRLDGYPTGETCFCSPLMWFVPPHTLWKDTHAGYVSRQQSVHLYICHIYFIWIRFSDPFSGTCASEANEFMNRW